MTPGTQRLDRRSKSDSTQVLAPVGFDAPTFAATAPARAKYFIAVVALLAIVCAVVIQAPPIWPTPWQIPTTLAFVLAIIYFNRASAYQRYGSFARVVGLESPIVLALLWLVAWHWYVIAVVAAEFGIFVREKRGDINPTIWYVRVFNASEIVVAGAAARTALSGVWHPGVIVQYGYAWLSPWIFVALLAGAITWKATDMMLTHVGLSLANGTPIRRFGVNGAQLYNECALLFAAVPLALCWSIEAWLALFVFASIAGGSMLVHFSEIEHRMKIDLMTGVANSSTFHEQFGAALAEGDKARNSIALLIIDIDHFKSVNDSFGHDFGDRTLSWFASILKAAARTDDVLGRIGGEEFAMLVLDTTRGEALNTAERLREAIAAAPYATPSAVPLALTASIGVAMFPEDGARPRELFHAADVALYSAKHGGRNLVRMARRHHDETLR